MQIKWHRQTCSQDLQASPPFAPYRKNRQLAVAIVDCVGSLPMLCRRLLLEVESFFGHPDTTLEMVADASRCCTGLMPDFQFGSSLPLEMVVGCSGH